MVRRRHISCSGNTESCLEKSKREFCVDYILFVCWFTTLFFHLDNHTYTHSCIRLIKVYFCCFCCCFCNYYYFLLVCLFSQCFLTFPNTPRHFPLELGLVFPPLFLKNVYNLVKTNWKFKGREREIVGCTAASTFAGES